VVLNYGPCGKQHWKNSTVLTIGDFDDYDMMTVEEDMMMIRVVVMKTGYILVRELQGKTGCLWIPRHVDLLNILKWVLEKYTTALIHQPVIGTNERLL
jgi:hypothetical protein